MEHLDQTLFRMGNHYRTIDLKKDLFIAVVKKIQKKQRKQNFLKALGIIFTSLLIMAGIVVIDKSYTLSVFIYISYAFIFMTFIVVFVIHMQKFLKRFLSDEMMEKVNHHKCYFVLE